MDTISYKNFGNLFSTFPFLQNFLYPVYFKLVLVLGLRKLRATNKQSYVEYLRTKLENYFNLKNIIINTSYVLRTILIINMRLK